MVCLTGGLFRGKVLYRLTPFFHHVGENMPAAAVRHYDYVGDGIYLHVTITVMPMAIEMKAATKSRPEEGYLPAATVCFWLYKTTFLATGSKDPILLHRIRQLLIDNRFSEEFPQADKAFFSWKRQLPTI